MAHILAELDHVVSMFIVNPHYPAVAFVDHVKLGMWLPVGGHIELGEDTDAALRRELAEETGLVVGQTADVYQTPDQLERNNRLRTAAVGNGESHNTRILYAPIATEVHNFPPLPGHRHLAHVFYVFARTRLLTLEAGAHRKILWLRRGDLTKPEYNIRPTLQVYAEEAMALRHPDRTD